MQQTCGLGPKAERAGDGEGLGCINCMSAQCMCVGVLGEGSINSLNLLAEQQANKP